MKPIDEQLESRIVRSLDHELSEDEQLELDRELLRNPDARRLMDEYRQLDSWSSHVLERVVGRESSVEYSHLTIRSVGQRQRILSTLVWLVPGAIAAALLAVVVNRASIPAPILRDSSMVAGNTSPTLKGGAPIADGVTLFSNASPTLKGGAPNVMRNAGWSPEGERIKTNTLRDLIGIVGDDGNIYWLERDHTRTVKQPQRGRDVRVSESL